MTLCYTKTKVYALQICKPTEWKTMMPLRNFDVLCWLNQNDFSYFNNLVFVRQCDGEAVCRLFKILAVAILGNDSFSELRRLVIWTVLPLQRFSGLGGGVINLIPTFSPLITTLKKQNFVILTFCYSLQTPIFFLWSSNKSFPKGFMNRSKNWFSDL